jgi:2-oxo-4-hydroxy-4-carboxy-5-ureidoimidazoline decarboxylase
MTVLTRWNRCTVQEAVREILPCCGSETWARELAERRPIPDESALVAASDEIWGRLRTEDWLEAFSKHPRIGDRKAPPATSTKSAAWSAQEQQSVTTAGESIQAALEQANQEYEQRFGRVFIVCATGKSATEMLDILRRRLRNDDAGELREAAEEQRKITNIRLQKWLSQ